MQVRDFMITKVLTVKPTCTIKDLLAILYTNRIGGVPVVNEAGNLIGMISDGDILRYLSPKPVGFAGLVYIIEDGEMEDVLREKLQTKVKDIMTKKIYSMYPLRTILKPLSVYCPSIISKTSCHQSGKASCRRSKQR